MALNISTQAILEKNKLASTGVWLLLLEFVYPGEDNIRVCYNTENIVWNGETWLACPFQLGDLEEDREGKAAQVTLSVIDIARNLTPILDEHGGGVGADVWVRVIHSDHLNLTDPELEEKFYIIDASVDHLNKVDFTLGSENLMNYRSPSDRYLKSHCRYQIFKGALCGYSGSETECNRTFTRCRELHNQHRFGGFPGVGLLGHWE